MNEEPINQPTESMSASEPVGTPEPKKSGLQQYWYLLVALVLVVFMSVGGIWFIKQGRFNPQPSPTPFPSPTAEADQGTEALDEQGSSDEIDEIEKDLDNTDLNNLDKELSDIESELATP